MDTESENEHESAVESGPASSPTDTRASVARSGADLERDVKVATRNGRYALIAALCAAIVSSVVAAGSAVYNTANELDRTENVAAAQALRADRQKIYTDYYNAAFGATASLGGLKAALSGDSPDPEMVRVAVVNFGERAQETGQVLGAVFLVGSEEMATCLEKFGDSMTEFMNVHLKPFSDEGITPGAANDTAARAANLIDDPTVLADIDRYTGDLTGYIADFVGQARNDLGAS